MIPLSSLGERICILGPSNSGKSTLATAIGRKLNLEVVHLDQLYHAPNTDWQARPTSEFLALHEAVITRDCWVIDGNYSGCMKQRIERATGLILLDVSVSTSLVRYVYRTLVERQRYGGLDGAPERIKWDMLHHIAVVTPINRSRYERMFHTIDLPKIRLSSVRQISQCYQHWNLP
ncbi:P-loop NTPase family protein [Spirosoma agri]|uniref:AAA family ATPase n=1 Tax=Spirosoma agri TaxID=1987381 RepID=UPI0014796E85|nr:AAA family ATPase [Spirosoma agri]